MCIRDRTFAEAIAHSCNPAFMTLGGMIGGHLFCQYHAAFGFTELTGIDMLGEARVTPTLYHVEESIRPVDVATSAIGPVSYTHLEPGQIAYITVEDAGADAGEDGTEPGFWESVWDAIAGFFGGGGGS